MLRYLEVSMGVTFEWLSPLHLEAGQKNLLGIRQHFEAEPAGVTVCSICVLSPLPQNRDV